MPAVRASGKSKPLIPDDLLIENYKIVAAKSGKYREKFVGDTRLIEELKFLCGQEFVGVPNDWIRERIPYLGKTGKANATGKRGPSKREDVPAGYKEYLLTPHWRTFRAMVLEWWDGKCALCNADRNVDVHHRTYKRLGHEQMNDCVALCRGCHVTADRARQREMKSAKPEKLFE